MGTQCLFSNLILDVDDLERSLAFYNGVLSLPIQHREVVDGNRLAYLETGGTHLLLIEQPRAERNPSLLRPGGMVVKFYVKGLTALTDTIRRGRWNVLQDLEVPSAGESTCLVADPDGYAVLLAEPVETLH